MFLMRTVFLEYTTHKHPRSRAYMKHIRLPEDDSFKRSREIKNSYNLKLIFCCFTLKTSESDIVEIV